MTTEIVAPTRTKSTREQRGVQLFRDRGEEIEHLNRQRWAVPACSGDHRYIADLRHQTCTCDDAIWQDGCCKHIAAATIKRSKTATCSGCGVRFPRRELVEVGEEQAAWTLALFVGDRLCPGCAREHGLA